MYSFNQDASNSRSVPGLISVIASKKYKNKIKAGFSSNFFLSRITFFFVLFFLLRKDFPNTISEFTQKNLPEQNKGSISIYLQFLDTREGLAWRDQTCRLLFHCFSFYLLNLYFILPFCNSSLCCHSTSIFFYTFSMSGPSLLLAVGVLSLHLPSVSSSSLIYLPRWCEGDIYTGNRRK